MAVTLERSLYCCATTVTLLYHLGPIFAERALCLKRFKHIGGFMCRRLRYYSFALLLWWELIPAIHFRFNTNMEYNAASYRPHLQWDHKEQIGVTNEQTLIIQRYYLCSVIDSILLHKEAIYFPSCLFQELLFNIDVCGVLFQF